MKKKSEPKQQGGTAFPIRTVKCPTCGKASVYSQQNAFRPFCSQHCQTGDLAAWASDEYSIACKEPIDPAHADSVDSDGVD